MHRRNVKELGKCTTDLKKGGGGSTCRSPKTQDFGGVDAGDAWALQAWWGDPLVAAQVSWSVGGGDQGPESP